MSTQREFLITLPSNVKTTGGNEENTISTYKTHLKKRFIFPPNEDWRVGLAEIYYPKTWYNVKQKAEIKFLEENGEYLKLDENVNLIIPSGYYKDCQTLLDVIKKEIEKLAERFLILPTIDFDELRNIVTINVGQYFVGNQKSIKCVPVFGEEIENILGFTKLRRTVECANGKSADDFVIYTRQLAKGIFKPDRIVDMKAGIYSIYVYTNIIEDTFVGNEYAPLLRTIPVKDSHFFGDVFDETFTSPYYIPLRIRNFDTIKIELKDDTGNPIRFESGRVVVKLIFKKYG